MVARVLTGRRGTDPPERSWTRYLREVSRLVLMCGLAGAGKSTYARTLQARGWTRFSIDAGAWEMGFTGAEAVPATVSAEIRARQRTAIADALDAGDDVVVDYSLWSRALRDEYRELGRVHGATVEVVFLDSDDALVRSRLAMRRGSHPDDVIVDDDLFDRYVQSFEAPGPDERDVTVIRSTS